MPKYRDEYGSSRPALSLVSISALVTICALVQPVAALAGATVAQPALKGAIAEGPSQATAIAITALGGYTTNSGPTLDEISGPVTDMRFDMTHVRRGATSELLVGVEVKDREFQSQSEARNLEYRVTGTLAYEPASERRFVTKALAERTVDVDEDLAKYGVEQVVELPSGSYAPFIKSSLYYLDYSDTSSFLLEFGNQDDRDRLSAAAQLGLRVTLWDPISVTVGVGVDAKKYTRMFDDFGLRRDSHSLYPIVGVGYSGETASLELIYAPTYRRYRESLFGSVYAQTLTALGEWRVRPDVRLALAARLGLDETDFLIAPAVEELSVLAGVTLTGTDESTLGLEAVYTHKDHLGLELIGLDRVDDKIELTLKGQRPIGAGVALVGEAKYLDFKSTFAGARTDMFQVLLGISYAPKI